MLLSLGNGQYSLTRQKNHNKLLILDDDHYVWKVKDNHQSLTRVEPVSHRSKPFLECYYWLFSAKNEPKLTNGQHLSIIIQPGKWEAYLLTPGLPVSIGDSCEVIATDERIARPHSRPIKQHAAK